MLLSIEPDSPVPIYQQIRDRIVEAIARGTQPAGSALPSTRQLATDLGINFHTVNKSYDILRQEGLVRINRKSGAVIHRDTGSGPPEPGYVEEWSARLRTLLAEAAAQGLGPQDIVDHCRRAVEDFTTRGAPPGAPDTAAGPETAGRPEPSAAPGTPEHGSAPAQRPQPPKESRS
ncbi:GntR family transcriptional regulator [Streptacidiphilus griseoplanus]|uniref:GntR family transcriptional regulator n=1 Tax=Peterkaempfera griseoplana TaxID=66896 RepID=UPI000AAF0A6E|nr:GntR family transcriptional regulator [Peterkaempfera griseoplana]